MQIPVIGRNTEQQARGRILEQRELREGWFFNLTFLPGLGMEPCYLDWGYLSGWT